MDRTSDKPLAGLDPAELLKQGAAEDTFIEGSSGSFIPPTPEELSKIFPRFEILELIGKGGMGAVYKVRQPELDRIVALKILHPEISDTESFSICFTREAKALAKLNHPGIVTIHESGHEGDLYYFLMEFVDGVNLRQLLENGRISPREAMAIVPQICDALQFAHDQGIVHRDIKPENLLLDRLGRVKVADFGIAKLIDTQEPEATTLQSEGTMFTDGGKIVGTPQYMAPEQGSQPSEVDHRADIFALGVVFYQMLTGELPEKDLQPPSQKITLDVRLDQIVLRALEQDPELRFSNATEMKTRIEGAAAVVTEKPAMRGKPKRQTKIVPILAAILFCIIAILLGIGGLLWIVYANLQSKKVTAMQEETKQAEQAFKTAEIVKAGLEKGIHLHSGKLLGGDEMTIIDLAAGKTYLLGDEVFEEAELPDFSLSYHQAADITNGVVMETRHFFITNADVFAWRRMSADFMPKRDYAKATSKRKPILIRAKEDEFGTSSVQFDPNDFYDHWYHFRLTLEDGRSAEGYIRRKANYKPDFEVEWTFRQYPKPDSPNTGS